MPTNPSIFLLKNRVSSLQILQEAYPNQIRIPLVNSASWLGISAGTARNWASAGTFPVPTQKIGDLRQVDIRDLAAYLDGALDGAEFPAGTTVADDKALTPKKRGRGRPPKGRTTEERA